MKLKALDQLWPLKVNTLRFKISVLYVAVIGLVLILIEGALYYNYVNSVADNFDTQLESKAEQVGGAVNIFRSMLGEQSQAFNLAAQKAVELRIDYPKYFFLSDSPERFWLADARKLGLEHDYLVIMDGQGHVMSQSKNVPQSLLSYMNSIKFLNFHSNVFYKPSIDGNILRVLIMPYFYAYNQGYFIAVASPYGLVEQILWQHFLFVIASTLAFLVIASVVVRSFVVSILSCVLEISNLARNISHENLSARIKLTHADEEIKHLTGSLNEMIDRLEKSFAHMKGFSLEMAHEVKTPLAIMSGKLQTTLEKECTAGEYEEILSGVLGEVRRMQQFVSDLLLLTKLDYRLIKLRFDSIDLTEFLREICAGMGVISAQERIVIQQDIAEGPLLLKGDKIHLRRVFYNLIDNALKFTPHGGRVDIVLKKSGQKAVVLISDTGPGIDPDELSKIFIKFYRSVEDHRKHVPGCGLGLSIAQAIVGLHHGQINVNSELGKGTTFKIEFPLV